jgi:putative tricarboxylic transport membrane protein
VKWKDRLSSICLLFFSGITIHLALKLPLGKGGKPGPGFFPLILSFVIGLMALLLLLKTSRSEGESKAQEAPSTKWRLVYLLGDLCLYAILFRPLGFLISTFLFLFALKPIVKKKWVPVLLGSSLISLSFLLFFKYLLKVELPMGILGK